MKSIHLACGACVLVDDDDFAIVSQYKWHVSHNGYAIRRVREPSGKKRLVYMHRVIFNTDAKDVDHRDGNKLNNSKANLRAASRTQNNANSKPREGCTSPFKGVFWNAKIKRYWAYIGSGKSRINLGYFKDEIEAAKAYNAMAPKLYGEFALLNQIPAS